MQLDLPPARAGRSIGLTPLIDVVFILLLFFLLASHFDQWQTLRLATTSTVVSDSHADDDRPPALLLRLHADGTLDINGELLEPHQLGRTLESYRARRPDLSVVLESDDQVRLQALVGVIDDVVASGIARLNLK